jgi:hypothetical protein
MISSLLLVASALLPHQARDVRFHGRLPAGAHSGRCLLVVDGQTRINGQCSYHIGKGGDFHIDGPRQVFDGIDYPIAQITAMQISTDYWARVFRNGDAWDGYGNGVIGSVHGDRSWGPLRREGACYIGKAVKVCLWGR